MGVSRDAIRRMLLSQTGFAGGSPLLEPQFGIHRGLGKMATGPISGSAVTSMPSVFNTAEQNAAIPVPPETFLGKVGALGQNISNRLNTALSSPLGQFSSNLLARSGPSLLPQSTLSNLGGAALSTRDDMLQRQLIESQLGLNQSRATQKPGDQRFGALNPSDFTPESLAAFQESNDFSDLVFRDKSSADPSAVREFEFFQGLSPEQQAEFLRVKRASGFEDAPGLGIIEQNPLGGAPNVVVPEETIVAGEAARTRSQQQAKVDPERVKQLPLEMESTVQRIEQIEAAINALQTGELDTGPFDQVFARFTSAGQRFGQLSGEAVIEAIGSATFGALSEGEREFLRSTTIDLGAQEGVNIDELNRMLRIARKAQEIQRDEMQRLSAIEGDEISSFKERGFSIQ